MSVLVKPSDVSPARTVAFEILRRVEEGAYASILLASREQKLSPADRGLCHELVMGVLRQQLWLDRTLQHFANRPAHELDAAVRIILRLGLYQLRFLSRIPASAAVNEAVNLVNRARVSSARGLVNAVLRRAAREPEFDPTAAIDDPVEKLSVATSHPQWLLQRWITSFGIEQTKALAVTNNEPAPIAFRVVRHKGGAGDVIEELRNGGAVVEASSVCRDGWRVSGGIQLLAGLAAEGRIYLQDEGSQLVTEVMAVEPGQNVLDLCAAPGSKATHIGDAIAASGTVIAADIHEHRIRTAAGSARLQGLNNTHCLVLDAARPLPFKTAFDRVLVDAPCSGTGTLRRNPEIRWRISTADIGDLRQRQIQLLLNAATAVKPNGRLVYSTCSIETEENEEVRQAFLENRNDFKPAELSIEPSLITGEGMARTWPQNHGTDGFFISAFERA